MKAWLIGGSVVLIAGCAPRPGPLPVPDAVMAGNAGVSLDSLQKGYRVYVSQCGRCHELISPKAVETSDWKLLIPGMCWNAGLSKADEAAVMNYVMVAKKK
jgi:cytochrome c5